jgi:DNA-binding IclR family transcriptional regulator
MTDLNPSEKSRAAGSAPRDPVRKAFDLLGKLVDLEEDSFTVRSLAQRFSMSASTMHRTLNALCNAGILRQNPSSLHYEFGAELHRISRRTLARFTLPELAMEHLRFLADQAGETALLGVYDDTEHRMMFAAAVEGGAALRYVVPLNSWVPIDRGASGLAIFAYLDEQTQQEILKSDQAGSRPLPTQDLQEQLALIRRQGYAITHGGRIAGATGLAAPVFAADGRVVADLNVTVPQLRFTPEIESRIAPLLLERADLLTRTLGGKPPDRRG